MTSQLGTGKSLTCFYSVNIYLVIVMSGQQSSWLRRMRLAGRSSVIITVRNSIENIPRDSKLYSFKGGSVKRFFELTFYSGDTFFLVPDYGIFRYSNFFISFQSPTCINIHALNLCVNNVNFAMV